MLELSVEWCLKVHTQHNTSSSEDFLKEITLESNEYKHKSENTLSIEVSCAKGASVS